MYVTLVVFYLSTGLAGCSVDPGISCGARKLIRSSQVKKKRKERRFLNLNQTASPTLDKREIKH